MPADWSRQEVEATVHEYVAMLKAEVEGVPYNKAEHNRSLRQQLRGRSTAAVERKHQNITAVLRDLGHPGIDGYKPLSNYQALLAEVVADMLDGDDRLARLVLTQVEGPAERPELKSVLALEDPPPEPDRAPAVKEPAAPPYAARVRRNVDYLAIEARNQSLGRAGEELVLRFEAERLCTAGEKKLANRIEHVSATKGDGLGYDVLSFETNGAERLIEVKTTSFGKRTPFYVTRNELARSRQTPEQYHLYRVFTFRQAPRLFRLRGRLDRVCDLDPVTYVGRVA